MILNDFFKLSKVTLISETKSRVKASKHTFRRRATKLADAHRWALDFTSIPLKYPVAMSLNARINSLGGQFGTVHIQNPLKFNGISQSIAINGAVLAGINQVVLSMQQALGALMPGDLIQFNHAKVYQVVNWNPDTLTAELYPRLFANVSADEVVKIGANVLFYCAHDGDVVDITVSNFNLPIPISAKFNEVIDD